MTETRMPRRPSAGRASDREGLAGGSDVRPEVSSAVGSAKPWLKATALVTVSTSGVVTGMTIAPGPTAALTSPSGVPASLPAGLQSALQAHLLADRTPAEPAASADAASPEESATADPGQAPSIPGLATPTLAPDASGPGKPAAPAHHAPAAARASAASHASGASHAKATTSSAAVPPETSSQRAFIGAVAPGAIAAEQRYGVPASVTIAQAIDESDWGRSLLAAKDNNLFGIKGTGSAGSVTYQTSEYEGGRWVTIDASFRAYHNFAESIEDHAALLATSGYYTRAMANRDSADAFANALTGVYATDPHYGAILIALMRTYDLYRYDTPAAAPAAAQHASGKSRTKAPAKPRKSAKGAAHAPAAAPAAPASPITGADIVPVLAPATEAPRAPSPGAASPGTTSPGATSAPPHAAPDATADIPGLITPATTVTAYYQPQLPDAVTTAFTATAKPAIAQLEPLYRDAATRAGISWKILAACDWMQCQARPRYSPVYGEKLGTVNPDGSRYATKSQALARCAADLTELASAVYGIDLTAKQPMSVRALAEVFAAYRWGGILARHGVSAMEFPYSVAGLTAAHTGMRWPAISDPDAPDRPGGKFRQPFGAVPVVLRLGYPATV
jgi:flagellum-specific peptidoglycan hydrolase FlgJ